MWLPNLVLPPVVVYPLAACALIGLVGAAGCLGSGARAAARAQAEREDRQRRDQDAILRLLDEMSALAQGDLTAEATVTEDVTGAIADAVNYTIEALRKLVTTIDTTAGQMAGACDDSLAITQELTRASRSQGEQIQTANAAIQTLLTSVAAISRDARGAAGVTDQAVAAAQAGGEAVRRTVAGMAQIRTQIQETTGGMERLGASSRQIGRTVELIRDFSEQTNTLALNAAIQAAMAGTAGRGFAVVADEVQRLAERAADATRQIEALVGAIQGDVEQATASMEKSTGGVVSGAGLVADAGSALEEIESVAQQTAELVGAIRSQSERQQAQAGRVAENMEAIRAITEQTADGTEAAGGASARVAELGVRLRTSISGFVLPPGKP